MITISVSNFKGGVGKTTVAYNLAYTLSTRGKSVLLIDLDPQGTLSYWVRDTDNVPVKVLAKQDVRSLANVLVPKEIGVERATLQEVTYQTRWEGVDIVPAYLALQKAKDAALFNPFSLSNAIDDLHDAYDFVIIDTRPDLDNKTTNAFVAAKYIILPVRCDGAMQEGLIESLDAIREICTELRVGQRNTKVLASMVKTGTIRDGVGVNMLNANIAKTNIFDCVIHDTAKLGEASMAGMAIGEYVTRARERKVAQDFEELADEVINWVK